MRVRFFGKERRKIGRENAPAGKKIWEEEV